MAKNIIPATEIRAGHPDIKKTHRTDFYYAKLAGRLLDDFIKTGVRLGKETPEILHYAAITLANYMEDIVADSGQWRMFSDLCQQMFGEPVPMYHNDEEEYYPDEPSLMAVRFLIWHAASEMSEYWWNADLEELDTLANAAYERLCDEFEKAPVNEQLTEDIDSMLKKAEQDTDGMRIALMWIFNNCYICNTKDNEKLMAEQMEDFSKVYDDIHDETMIWYYAFTKCIIAFKVGPLALYPKEYLAKLARNRNFPRLAGQLEEIEATPLKAFLYEANEDRTSFHLRCTDDKEMDVARDEITLNDKDLDECDGFGASLVKYKGTWHLNGILVPMENAVEKWDILCEEDPHNLKNGRSIMGPEEYLLRTDGKRLLFLKNLKDAMDFMITKMGAKPGSLSSFDIDKNFDQPVTVFIDTCEKEECLRFSIGYTHCICAPENPYYDAATAQEDVLQILWRNDRIGSSIVLYLLDKDYLPDLPNDKIFCKHDTLQTRKADAHFLLRYMRQNRY